MFDPTWTDHSDPAEEPDDWQEAWDAMAETMDDQEAASPSVQDWLDPRAFDAWRDADGHLIGVVPLPLSGLREEAAK